MESNLISELNHLSKLQCDRQNDIFPIGLFPSYRYNNAFKLKRADDNIFFSASIAFILKRSFSLFNDDERAIANTIIGHVVANYDDYKNHQRLSYNFWKRQPRKWFPNGNLLHRLKHFALPDDVDTSAMIMLTIDSSREQVEAFHQLLKSHANGVRLTAKGGFEQFRSMPTYSTWLGDKMSIETDVCVLSNLMYLFLSFDLEMNRHDEAVRNLFDKIICQRLYISNPFKASPEYPKVDIILFHFSRLAGFFPHFFSPLAIDILITDAQFLYEKSDGFSRMLIEISLHYLNYPVKYPLVVSPMYNDADDWWFTAGLLSVFGNPVAQYLAPFEVFHLRFYSEAFVNTMFIEHQALYRKVK